MSPSSPIRVASYNLRKCRGTDGRRDPGRVLAVIAGLNADVVALQEADLRLGPRHAALPPAMVEAESDFELVPLATSPVSVGWHGNAVLVRKGLAHSEAQRIELPGLEPRGAVAVEVEGLRLVGVHLGLLRSSRRAQLHHLRARLEALPPRPTVITGDFNEWRAARGLEPLAGAFETHAPGRSFPTRRPLAALDRLALSPELTLEAAGVEAGPLARRASDHLPIWADIARAAS
ncbi:endonuclease/exonuclease/phosphatase family protein [Vannielia litorea]|uniref:endonuclease/exonuclease/phosphatase family protein n=1 Tax=Vannielia litorea TaxID=1217970 RepID=UPI001BCF0F8F|nr:endonuclease/exonuclease/phosphatase family protein [Vannielia litorea]MBS8228957.1 metal-dependent hydrolase [Vannielia litorea]